MADRLVPFGHILGMERIQLQTVYPITTCATLPDNLTKFCGSRASRQSRSSLLRESLVIILHGACSFDSRLTTRPLVASLRYLDFSKDCCGCRSIHPTSNRNIPQAFYVESLRMLIHIPKQPFLLLLNAPLTLPLVLRVLGRE